MNPTALCLQLRLRQGVSGLNSRQVQCCSRRAHKLRTRVSVEVLCVPGCIRLQCMMCVNLIAEVKEKR